MEDQNRTGDGRRGGGPPPGGGRRRRRRRRRGRGPAEGFSPQGAPRGTETVRSGRIEPFELFCALYLGITPQNTYRPANVPQVARRFNTTPEAIRELLVRYAMDKADLQRAKFDVGLAQLDMQVLPDGIDRTEQAKVLWNELLELSPATREAVERARREAEEAAAGLASEEIDDEEGDEGDEDLGEEEAVEASPAEEAAPAPETTAVEVEAPRARRSRSRRKADEGASAGEGAN